MSDLSFVSAITSTSATEAEQKPAKSSILVKEMHQKYIFLTCLLYGGNLRQKIFIILILFICSTVDAVTASERFLWLD